MIHHELMSSGGSFGEWVGRNLLFSDVLESDTRVPCMTFAINANFLKLIGVDRGDTKFGLLAPRIEFWIALVTVRGQLTISENNLS